jgi:hypothetical protein
MLPVYLGCPFLIAVSGFSNVYLLFVLIKEILLYTIFNIKARAVINKYTCTGNIYKYRIAARVLYMIFSIDFTLIIVIIQILFAILHNQRIAIISPRYF